jgi:hypothetical protein
VISRAIALPSQLISRSFFLPFVNIAKEFYVLQHLGARFERQDLMTLVFGFRHAQAILQSLVSF